jgi:hypothetical protein
MRPDASENSQISPSTIVRAARAAGSHPTSRQSCCKAANIYASSGVIRGIPVKDYWLTQIDVHRQMVTAWIANAQGKREEALQMLRTAADREDAIERDPVVPGPIISARELLGEMLHYSKK